MMCVCITRKVTNPRREPIVMSISSEKKGWEKRGLTCKDRIVERKTNPKEQRARIERDAGDVFEDFGNTDNAGDGATSASSEPNVALEPCSAWVILSRSGSVLAQKSHQVEYDEQISALDFQRERGNCCEDFMEEKATRMS